MRARAALCTLLASVLIAAPGIAQERVYRIGYVSSSVSTVPNDASAEALRRGLLELGYVEGKNLLLEIRFAQGRRERLPELFAELLRLKIDVLVAAAPAVIEAKNAVTTVPVVFGGVIDPVGQGLVASLARPGGNMTGAASGIGGAGFHGKCLELLKEAAPGLSHVAVLVEPLHRLKAQIAGEVQAAARTFNLKSEVFEAGNAADLEKALAAIGASGAQGIFVAPGTFLTDSSAMIAQFAASRRLSTFHFSKRFADAGGLMSYGASLEDSYRRAAKHVDKILRGAKPADLPIDQATKFELVINMKTAKAIGLKVPQSLLLRADHVIE